MVRQTAAILRGVEEPPSPSTRPRPSSALLGAATLGLFLVWSHTFLAFEVLLAPATGPAPMGWLALVVARFVPVTCLAAAWCFGARRTESLALLRERPGRLVACGLSCVFAYNALLYYGMERRVAGPIASLLTTLSPVYLLVLGVAFLGERLTARKVGSLALGLAGVALIATAKEGPGGTYAADVAVVSLAPLAWSVYSALSKPVLRTGSPVLWTYLVLVVGGAPLLLLAPFVGGPEVLRLDAGGLALLAYLAVAATLLGNAVWSWLLRHLPASTVGLTVFLNPPLTTASKHLWAALFPAAFAFTVAPREWLGGALALAGVAVAVFPRRRSA